ncbi:hypothetical protein BC833DRAFT_579478 [Globomyces pollinis-pini]|nr:hypothetical protein BC833DRAFT_579478 [Globomyces pollinis-pini]
MGTGLSWTWSTATIYRHKDFLPSFPTLRAFLSYPYIVPTIACSIITALSTLFLLCLILSCYGGLEFISSHHLSSLLNIPISSFHGYSLALPSQSLSFLLMVPGLTLSIIASCYWIFTIFLSSIIHEFGHSLLALIHHVDLVDLGIFVHFGLPGAFVALDDTQFNTKSNYIKLLILCAGPLHNFLLCIISKFALSNLITMFAWGYAISNHVMILNVKPNLGLNSHFYKGLVIDSINGHQLVTGLQDYKDTFAKQTLNNVITKKCFYPTIIPKSDIHCCSTATFDFKNTTNCVWDLKSIETFQLITKHITQNEDTNGIIRGMNIYPNMCNLLSLEFLDGVDCNRNEDCSEHQVCMGTALFDDKRIIKMNVFDISSPSKMKPITFIGSPNSFLSSVLVTEILPIWPFLPRSLPYNTEIIFRYLYSLNLTLGFFNLIPAFKLDGYHILLVLPKLLRDIGVLKKKHLESSLFICRQIVSINSMLLVLICALSIFKLLI